MTRSHPETPATARRQAAQASLASLMTWLGDAGLTAATALPGLLAELDQHAAAVIEALCGGGHALGPVALAGYASGVHDAATERGWRPSPSVDWPRADWATLRLVSVCAVARAARYA